MPRANSSVPRHRRHRKVVKQAKGYYGARSRNFKAAKDAVEKAGLAKSMSHISTGGGAVYDMFGVIDMMSIVKKRRDIATLGTGKVFSAGVPLLASGTKGKRFVTRNARIMMHRCSTASMGTTADMKSSHDEMRLMEDQMVRVIAENSELSVGEIHNMFSKNTDEYFSAQEAIEMGLADEII